MTGHEVKVGAEGQSYPRPSAVESAEATSARHPNVMARLTASEREDERRKKKAAP